MLLTSPDARAGSYSASYSGGTYNGLGGQYGAPGTYNDSGGSGSGSEGGGGASCQGAISATLTWQPAYTGEPAPPSNSVIVTETGTAKSQTLASASGSAVAKCDDGMGQPGSKQSMNGVAQYSSGSNPQVTGYFAQVSASDVRYTAGGGASIPLSATPTGSVTDTGAESSAASVSYSASATLVTISLGGTMPVSGVQYGLTGQQITATLNGIPSGFTVTSYTWAAGGSTFKNYDPTLPSNQLVQIGSTDLSGPASGSTTVAPLAFYDSAAENLTVTCKLTVTAPDGSTLNLTATAPQINMEKPTASWTAYTSGPFVNNSGGYGATEYWNPATITVPSPFSGGTGCFAQLITPSRQTTRSSPPGTPMVYAATYSAKIPDGNGGWMLPSVGLDTAFPYPFGTTASSGAQVSSNYTWDVSSQGESGDMPTAPYNPPAVSGDMGGTNWYTATMKDAFTTWVMYKPNGGVWVPLQNLSWSTNITVSDTSGSWSVSSGSTVTTPSSGTNASAPPTWTTVNNASQVQMRP